jgi:competence protein ComEC
VRLVLWTAACAFGIALPAAVTLGWVGIAALAGGAVAVVALARGHRAAAAGAGLCLLAGVLLGTRAERNLSQGAPQLDPAVAAAVAADRASAVLARVARGPEWAGRGARLIVEIESLDGAPARATLALSVVSGWPDFGPGERVAFAARLRAVRGTRNPGLPDPARALRAAGIDVLAGVAAPSAVARVAEPARGGVRRAAFLARRAMRAAIDRAVGGAAGGFLKTAVLGDRRGVGDDVEEGFRAAGATHVLSVSGLHLAAVAALLFLLVRSLAALVPGLPLYVDPRAVAAAVALPAIGFFTLLTGEAVATERSALMLAIGMGGLLLGRPVSAAPTIAAAALVLLVAGPLRLFDVSLQLSLASVAGIALLARRLARVVDGAPGRGRRRMRWALRWLGRFGAATLAATAATGPLVAHCFGEIALAAPLGNLALVPLVEMLVVPCGLLGAAAGAVWEPLGRAPFAVAAAAARAALAVAAAFRGHAPLVTCRTPDGLETAALTAAGLLALWAVAARGRARKLALAGAVVAAAAGAASLLARDLARRHARDARVTFLDVGQGDAAVVEAPGGAVMVVDGGGAFDGAFDPGERIVEPFLRARGIARVDVVALSHPHPDHLNGLLRIVGRFEVGALWTSGDDGRNPDYRRLLEAARRRGVPAPVPAPARLGPVTVEPLGPFVAADAGAGAGAGERIGPPPGLSVNDASLVLRVAFGGRAVLFAGDLEADGEGELAGRRAVGQRVAADVLKVPHHGSRTSSTPELVQAVAPDLAVISLGWRNRFHFPAPEVVARYEDAGARVLRTDRDGAVTVTIAPGSAMRVACERGCPPLR